MESFDVALPGTPVLLVRGIGGEERRLLDKGMVRFRFQDWTTKGYAVVTSVDDPEASGSLPYLLHPEALELHGWSDGPAKKVHFQKRGRHA